MWWSWLCSKLFSLRDVNFGMTSDPSLATLLSNALTCPQPTIHTSVTTTWKRGSCDVFYFFLGGGRVLYDKAQSSGLIKAVKDVRECKTLDGRFALICKVVSVYAPVCPPRTRVSTEDLCVHRRPVCPLRTRVSTLLFLGVWISRQGQKQRFRAREGGQGIMSMWCLIRLRVLEDCLEALCVTSPSSWQSVTVKRCFLHFLSC